MARTNVKGTKQLNRELPAELVDAFSEFCKRHGVKVAAELALAIRRHMEFPPDRSALTPIPPVSPVAGEGNPPVGENPPPAGAKKKRTA